MLYKLLGIGLVLLGLTFPFGLISCREVLCEIFLCVLFISMGLLILIKSKKDESERR